MHTRVLLDTLQIRFPVIQAPMLGVSSPEMVAAASDAGGLGSLPVGGLSPDAVAALLHRINTLTSRPYAVNLFVHHIPEVDITTLEPMRRLIQQLAKEHGYVLTDTDLQLPRFYSYKDQLEVLIRERVRIISFTFGCPDDKSIALLKKNNILLIGTATSLEEAVYLQNKGIDMVVAQGIEAGGHRGSFLNENVLPQQPLEVLLRQVKAALTIPLIAAGGIRNSGTAKTLFDQGAAAIQLGTLFIPTDESLAISSYKKMLTGEDPRSVLTTAFSGRWARGISNAFITAIETSGIPVPPYPYQNALTAPLRKMAQAQDDPEFTSLWAGTELPLTATADSAAVIVESFGRALLAV
ncbi:NAD(P)H-dependent flavin oxidoreductase [Niabella beijingensis]|uniref:NAD(P)H-dependent flavin oxidoreductase n=1 Tax=Niabella beijingensis TaxID=2872700 RepID=UPI001CC147B9|nr:nitronate monooxygenase [Niabella beijingensis]MBZ4187946.1 nitronate monooxygenase [Niabella beijingensis]